jgi:hypothetical protein
VRIAQQRCLLLLCVCMHDQQVQLAILQRAQGTAGFNMSFAHGRLSCRLVSFLVRRCGCRCRGCELYHPRALISMTANDIVPRRLLLLLQVLQVARTLLPLQHQL